MRSRTQPYFSHREMSHHDDGMTNQLIKSQLEVIKRGSEELLVERELAEKLSTGRPLRVKAGFDPTAPMSRWVRRGLGRSRSRLIKSTARRSLVTGADYSHRHECQCRSM